MSTTAYAPVPVSPLQLRLKTFCVWIETKFECRANRLAFALRMAFAAAGFYGLFAAHQTWLADAPAALAVPFWLAVAWLAFWVILQIVRRFHDLGRTGGLFWALAVPLGVSWRVAKLFHIADKPELQWMWYLLAAFCAWSFWLILQLFLRSGTDGANGYEGRETGKLDIQ